MFPQGKYSWVDTYIHWSNSFHRDFLLPSTADVVYTLLTYSTLGCQHQEVQKIFHLSLNLPQSIAECCNCNLKMMLNSINLNCFNLHLIELIKNSSSLQGLLY